MEKKIFVTGGAGFIGSHLVDQLVKNGSYVTVYDNFSSGKLEFLKQHIKNKKINLIKGDLLDLKLLKRSIKNHSVVFHLAANPDIRLGIKVTNTDLTQNTLATYHVLEAMRLNDVKEIVLASTSAIYGEPNIMPTPEDYGPLLPISLYGASKLACEALCTSFTHTFGMKCWIYRFANIVGGRATHGLIYDLIRKLKVNPKVLEVLGNGKQDKSYLLVDDCVGAMLFGYQHAHQQVNVFNIGCNDSIKIGLIAKRLIKRLPFKNVTINFTGDRRGWPGDVVAMLLSTKKINALGWRATYNSSQAIDITIERMLKECKW